MILMRAATIISAFNVMYISCQTSSRVKNMSKIELYDPVTVCSTYISLNKIYFMLLIDTTLNGCPIRWNVLNASSTGENLYQKATFRSWTVL
jgi:hypothetical protein